MPLSAHLIIQTFAGTNKNQKAMSNLTPVPTPRVAGDPMTSIKARPANPPTKRARMAISLWSRETTPLRSVKSLGSATSSHHTVVRTTGKECQNADAPQQIVEHLNIPVVANCVFTLFPMMPCKPRLALKKPMVTKARTPVQAGFPRDSAMLG